MAQQRTDRVVTRQDKTKEECWKSFVRAWDDLAAEIAKLSPEDQARLERELNEAVDSAIQRRVDQLDREAARDAVP